MTLSIKNLIAEICNPLALYGWYFRRARHWWGTSFWASTWLRIFDCWSRQESCGNIYFERLLACRSAYNSNLQVINIGNEHLPLIAKVRKKTIEEVETGRGVFVNAWKERHHDFTAAQSGDTNYHWENDWVNTPQSMAEIMKMMALESSTSKKMMLMFTPLLMYMVLSEHKAQKVHRRPPTIQFKRRLFFHQGPKAAFQRSSTAFLSVCCRTGFHQRPVNLRIRCQVQNWSF